MADPADMSSAGDGAEREFLAIDTPFGDTDVVLLEVAGEDVLSRCFLYRATITTQSHASSMETLLGKPVTLWLSDGNAGSHRPIHGNVRRVRACGTTTRGRARFELEVVPRLWFLSCTADCRIFQHQNVPDIIRTIFHEHGLQNFKFRLTEQDYPPLDYCVQYRESAFDFVSRLLEHLGLFYWHEHEASKHTLMIASSNLSTSRTTPYTLTVLPNSVWGNLTSLDLDSAFRPGKWTLNDYDFESPTRQLLVDMPTVLDVPRMADHEIYEYPGQFSDPDEGRRLTRLRIEMEEAQHRRVTGAGNVVTFDPGRRFEVEDEQGTQNAYLLTEVRHRASWAGREAGGINENTEYANDYVAIPAASMFRPERLTPRPFIRGVQTATVVGPPGENIYCDEYGRVRVQFHWDRRGQRNEGSSCWVRVAQARSGAHYGTFVVPHVGHEVLVEFIEGDPNRPLITGTAPNAMMMPPVPLPQDKNKTVQRDHGNNKIVMHGVAGSEYLSLSSPKTLNLFVSGRHARPLSADFAYSGDTDPTGSDVTVAINDFKDAAGLKQLHDHWHGVVSGGSDASSQTNENAAANESYMNSGTEGRANTVVLGNNNAWTNGDANTWVNGNVYTQINQSSYTVVGGTAYGGSNTSVTSSLEVYGENDTKVHGSNYTYVDALNYTKAATNTTMVDGENYTQAATNITIVEGDNSQVVLGANDSLTLGTNDSLNIGLNTAINVIGNVAVNVGANLALNAGINTQINGGLNLNINGGVSIALTTGVNLTITGGAAVDAVPVKMSELGTHLSTGAAAISTRVLHLFV